MGDLVTTAVYTAIFGFALGVGVYWMRNPDRMRAFLRGTVFEPWTEWLVPWMTWGLIVVGALALGFQVSDWLS